METPEEFEFTQEEQELRELRGVLGEPRKSRSSFQASFVLGGLLCLVGAGAFFAVDKFLPAPVDVADATPPDAKEPKAADPAASKDPENPPDRADEETIAVAAASSDAQPEVVESPAAEVAAADGATIATPSVADGAERGDGSLPSVERSIVSAELAEIAGAGPEIGTNAQPSSGDEVRIALVSPVTAGAPQNLVAEPENPSISALGERPTAPGPANSVETPQIASLSTPDRINSAASGGFVRSLPKSLGSAQTPSAEPTNPQIAALGLRPIEPGPASSVDLPRVAALSDRAGLVGTGPKPIASAQNLGAEPANPLIAGTALTPAESGGVPTVAPPQIASLSVEGGANVSSAQADSGVAGGGLVRSLPKPIAATQDLPSEPRNPQIASLGVDQFALGRSPSLAPPLISSRSTSNGAGAAGAETTVKALPKPIASAQALSAEPRRPQIAALGLRPTDLGLAAPATLPLANSTALTQKPSHADVAVVAALGTGPEQAAISGSLAAPLASPGARSPAPMLPNISEIAVYDAGSSSSDAETPVFFPNAAATALHAEPASPNYPKYASLDIDLSQISVAADIGAPASILRTPNSDPSYVETVKNIELASISEATPVLSGSLATTPHAVRADGAAQSKVAELLVGYDLATAPNSNGDAAAADARTGPAAPGGVDAPAALVQLASASPVDFTFSEAPKTFTQTALTATLGDVRIGEQPALPADAQPASAAPALEHLLGEPSADRRQELVIASIGLGAPHVFDVETDADQVVISSYMIGDAPEFDLPSTPNVVVDPAVEISLPRNAVPATAGASAPTLLASLGAQPHTGFAPAATPAALAPVHQDDAGRDEARAAVMAAIQGAGDPALRVVRQEDTRPAWIRNGVAPPANPKGLPVLAIVIDEVGDYGASVQDVKSMPRAVTVSVIPSTPKAARIAETLLASRREVLVHMPMEANSDADLGPRPILKAMSDVQVQETADWHLSQFGGYIGVNSHRGGAATEDKRVMKTVMAEIAERGGLFLDSRNSGDSVAEQTAREAGLLAVGNNVFIDEKQFTSAIHKQLDAAAAQAAKNGGAIAIGNPHAVTIQSVKSWIKKHDGVKVVVAPLTHVAQVMNGARGDGIIIAGAPPEKPKVVVSYSEAAESIKESAEEGIRGTLSGIAAKIGQSFFNGRIID